MGKGALEEQNRISEDTWDRCKWTMHSDRVKGAGNPYSPTHQDTDRVNTGLSFTESRDPEPLEGGLWKMWRSWSSLSLMGLGMR